MESHGSIIQEERRNAHQASLTGHSELRVVVAEFQELLEIFYMLTDVNHLETVVILCRSLHICAIVASVHYKYFNHSRYFYVYKKFRSRSYRPSQGLEGGEEVAVEDGIGGDETAEDYFGEGAGGLGVVCMCDGIGGECVDAQIVKNGDEGNRGGEGDGIAVDAGTNAWEGDGAQVMGLCEIEGRFVAGGEEFRFAMGAAVPDGADGVDDLLAGEVVGIGNFTLSGLAAPESAAFSEQAGAGSAMDGPVHSPAAEQRTVGSIHYGIDLKLSDVAVDHFDHFLQFGDVAADGADFSF